MRTRCSPLLRRRDRWWVAFCIWFALLWLLSSQPPRDLPSPGIPHFDKVAHAIYFGCGGAILGTALALSAREGSARSGTALGLAALALLALIGALDEWHQTWTPGRHGADPFDWIADFVGAALGIALVKRIRAPRPS